MLSNTFGLVPATTITKHYRKLQNPAITLTTKRIGASSGNVHEAMITIPKVFAMDDTDVPSYADFVENVKRLRKRFGIHDVASEVSQLPSDKIPKSGGKGGIYNYGSTGQVLVASFLDEGDLGLLANMSTLVPLMPQRKEVEALSRLLSSLSRSVFITDEDGASCLFKEYYQSYFPMFSIDTFETVNRFHFNHCKLISTEFAL